MYQHVLERAAHLTTREEAARILSTQAPGRAHFDERHQLLEVDGSGVRTSAMPAMYALLAATTMDLILERTRDVLRHREVAVNNQVGSRVSRFKARCTNSSPITSVTPFASSTTAAAAVTPRPSNPTTVNTRTIREVPPPVFGPARILQGDTGVVHMVAGVFDKAQCGFILTAVRRAASARGGWDTSRHGRYPTTDMPLCDLGPAVETLVREAVFTHILRRFSDTYCGIGSLPEQLHFRDLFVVRYATSEGAQRDLAMHQDGSTFSFNLLLSSRSAFEGGGTIFEPGGYVLTPEQGSALVHSGDIHHGGREITSGERLLLVGFIGVDAHAYSAKSAGMAAYEAFCKFGHAAWHRSENPGDGAARGEAIQAAGMDDGTSTTGQAHGRSDLVTHMCQGQQHTVTSLSATDTIQLRSM